MEGAFREWSSVGDGGLRTTFRFCATCGSTVAYASEHIPGVTAVAVGAFADPGFAPPERSVFEDRKYPWVAILGDGVVHLG